VLISNYITSSPKNVEIDGILLSAHFICTVEIKYTSLRGRLAVHQNRDWTIDGQVDSGLKNPTFQARKQAQQLGPLVRKACTAVGKIDAVVLVGGDVDLDPIHKDAILVCAKKNFDQCLALVTETRRALNTSDVDVIMQTLGLDEISLDLLEAEGFEIPRQPGNPLPFDSYKSERKRDSNSAIVDSERIAAAMGDDSRFLPVLCAIAGVLRAQCSDDLDGCVVMDMSSLRAMIRVHFPMLREVMVQQMANFVSYLYDIDVHYDHSCIWLDEVWASRFAERIHEALAVESG
jgi:hypothetical protein